jgi:hypothetical protein
LQWIGDENEREEGETGRGIETANGIVGTGREKETEIGIGTETGDVSRDLVLGLQWMIGIGDRTPLSIDMEIGGIRRQTREGMAAEERGREAEIEDMRQRVTRQERRETKRWWQINGTKEAKVSMD